MAQKIKSVLLACEVMGRQEEWIHTELVFGGFEVVVLLTTPEHYKPKSMGIPFVETDCDSADTVLDTLKNKIGPTDALVVPGGWDQRPHDRLRVMKAAQAFGIKHFVLCGVLAPLRCESICNLARGSSWEAEDNFLAQGGRDGHLTYTVIQVGMTFDDAVSFVYLLCPFKIFNGGEVRFSFARETQIAGAVSNVLLRATEMKNRRLSLECGVMTQNEILQCAKTTLPDRDFGVEHVSKETIWADAVQSCRGRETGKLAKHLLEFAVFAEGQGLLKENDNELLGMELASKDDLMVYMKEW